MPDQGRLFFYGTLRDMDLLRTVVGHDCASLTIVPGILDGYEARVVAGESFPMLVRRPGGIATGIVVSNLSEPDMERIIWFEDTDYGFEDVIISTDEGPLSARFFAASDKLRDTTETWRLEHWQRTGKPLLMLCAEGYLALYGTMTMAEAEARWPAIKARAEAQLKAAGPSGHHAFAY